MNDPTPTHERRFNPEYLDRLVEPERQKRWNPVLKLTVTGIKPGIRVLELGSGPGFWTGPITDLVGPRGLVVALDVSSAMLHALKNLSLQENVTAIQSELPHIPLSDSWAEFVWLAFIFHEVDPPSVLAEELFRVTKQGAQVAVLNWQKEKPGGDGPPKAHSLSATHVRTLLTSAGFTRVQIRWQDEEAYLIKAWNDSSPRNGK